VLDALRLAARLRRRPDRVSNAATSVTAAGRVQADAEAVGAEHGVGGRAGRLQLIPERRQRRAQAGAARLRVAVRPEHLDQDLTRVRLLAMAGQEREQRADLVRVKALDNVIVLLGAQAAEQGDFPRLDHQHDLRHPVRSRAGRRRDPLTNSSLTRFSKGTLKSPA
jgi:hypothetical protein